MTEFSDKSLENRKLEDFAHVTRGETPEDIRNRCHKLCAEYLGGVWNKITEEQINVKRISGGYTNQLYYCGLAEGIEIVGDEPKEVAIKLYGRKWFNSSEDNERLSDMIIVLLASEHNIGPKIYGIFNDGEVGEYVQSHQFRIKDQQNPLLVKELSKKLAQFHSLDVPLAKNVDWLKNYFDEYYEKAYKEFPIDDIIKEIKAENLINTNVKQEYEWLLRCIDAINSPIVFSHNDFRGSNQLVHERVNDKDQRMVTLCDFEYSCYYYRGFDLGVGLNEFGQQELGTYKDLESDEVLEEFLRGYLEESIRINGEEYGLNSQNSIKQLLRETKVFTLAAYMFGIMFLYNAKELPFTKNKNDIMVAANRVLGNYLKRKQNLDRQGVLPKLP